MNYAFFQKKFFAHTARRCVPVRMQRSETAHEALARGAPENAGRRSGAAACAPFRRIRRLRAAQAYLPISAEFENANHAIPSTDRAHSPPARREKFSPISGV